MDVYFAGIYLNNIDTNIQLAILSIKLPVILGMNAAVKILWPVDNSHAKIRSMPPPVSPPPGSFQNASKNGVRPE